MRKSEFDYLHKKQTIDGWTNDSHSIAIFGISIGRGELKGEGGLARGRVELQGGREEWRKKWGT